MANKPGRAKQFLQDPVAGRLAKRSGCLGGETTLILAAILGPLISLLTIIGMAI
jgi:hypothetical protein